MLLIFRFGKHSHPNTGSTTIDLGFSMSPLAITYLSDPLSLAISIVLCPASVQYMVSEI